MSRSRSPDEQSRILRACAFWNDEAGANAWNASQNAKLEADRHSGEADAARLWAQAKRLHALADSLICAEAA